MFSGCFNDAGSSNTSCTRQTGQGCPDSSCALAVTEQDRLAFRKDFFDTLKGFAEGAITSHLYHQFPPDQEDTRHALYGADAWDAYNANPGSLQLGEVNLFHKARRDGVLEQFLPKKMQVAEYGTGGRSGFRKMQAFLTEALSLNCQIERYIPVDIVPRYVHESETAIVHNFNIVARGVPADFTGERQPSLPLVEDPRVIPLAVIIGGTLANSPDHSAIEKFSGNDNARFSGIENAALTLSRIRNQCGRLHGTETRLMLTFHETCDIDGLMRVYKPTEVLEAWALSGFARAVAEGLITDPDYKPTENWRICPSYDAERKALLYSAEATRDHDIPTLEGIFSYKKGDRINHILSHKWGLEDYRQIFLLAGFEISGIYRPKGSPTGLLFGKAIVPTPSVVRPEAGIVIRRLT